MRTHRLYLCITAGLAAMGAVVSHTAPAHASLHPAATGVRHLPAGMTTVDIIDPAVSSGNPVLLAQVTVGVALAHASLAIPLPPPVTTLPPPPPPTGANGAASSPSVPAPAPSPAPARPAVPASVPAPSPTPPPQSGPPAGQPSPATWAALRQCESGGNYAENTGNGFYGAYQFTLSTWEELGYAGLPSLAPPSVQNQAAARLQALRGWDQWPVCSVRLGF